MLLLFWLKPIRKFKSVKRLTLFPLLLFLLHASIEGLRWQMVPAYGIAIIITLVAFVPTVLHLPRYLRIILSLLGALLVVISLLLGYLLPVFQLPKPSGTFAVGTTYLHLQDSARPEPITLDTTDMRELMVRVWYPAESREQKTYSYMPPELAKTLIKSYGLPGFMLSHFDLIETHALLDATVASEGEFPAIIFSPGYMSHSSMYTSLLETLASHGYIIFSIDYTYETPLSVFPNNGLRFFDPTYTDVWKNASWDDVQTSISAFRDATDPATKRLYVSQYLTQTPYTARVDFWVKDVSFVIDQLKNKGQQFDKPFFSRIDLNNIGVMGHSVGGATSAVACAIDSRIKAGINLDGSQWGSIMSHTITQPFLWITAEKDMTASSLDIDSFIYDQVSKGDFHHLSIEHATHANFYDLSLWSNYSPFTQTGSINGHKMIEIVNRCSLDFFDKYLKRKSVMIDHLTEEFDELTSKDR